MRLVSHPNVVALKAFFYSNGDKKDEVFLNLVLEYVPETVYRASRHYTKMKQVMPMLYVKVSYVALVAMLTLSNTLPQLYMYQVLRSLAYIHSLGICHRDIKPQNLVSIFKLSEDEHFVSKETFTKNSSWILRRES